MTITAPPASKTLDLRLLYHPRGLALVGATEGDRNPGQQTLRLMEVAEKRGAIFYPVSATRDTVYGIPAYRSLADIPGPVDVAVFQVGDPAAAIRDLPEDAPVPTFAIVFTSGYSEVGTTAGIASQRVLLDACHARGIRLMGPNTNLNALEIRAHERTLPRVGLVTQSGAQGRPIVEAEGLGIEFSYWAPTGNEADLEAADFIEFLARDEDTSTVAAYIEGFVSGPRLREAAVAALEHGTPIVLIKVGRSEVGERLAISHTAHLAGVDAVHDAFFEQYGITRVDDLDELLEVSTALARAPMPTADGIVLWGISGGSVVHLADLAGTLGLDIPKLSTETQAKLREHIPDYLMVSNPVDNGGHSLLSGHGADDLRAILSDEATGVLICSLPGNFGDMAAVIADDLETVREEFDKPIVAVWPSPQRSGPAHQRLLDMGIPVFSNARNALVGARALTRRRRIDLNRAEFLTAARALPTGTISQAPSEFTRVLDEAESMAWLSERGIPVVQHRAVSTIDEALAASDDIGYPIVLKGRGSDLTHKTELGLVRVGITNADELRAACMEMSESASGHSDLDGFIVAELVDEPIELLLGLSTDDVFGPVITVGSGGIEAEALADVAHSVLPITPSRAGEMISRLRMAPLLDGWRGRPPANLSAITKVILAMAEIAAEGSAVEIDINPLAVTRGRVLAIDALVRLRTSP